MSDNIIRVRAGFLDTVKLTLYKEDGTTVEIPQGDARIQGIVNLISPIVLAGGIASVDLGEDPAKKVEPNSAGYHEFEKKSLFTRFFRVAKDKLFGTKEAETAPHLPPMEIVPPQLTAPPVVTQLAPTIDPGNAKIINAVEEIMKHAVPASDPAFTVKGTEETKDTDTIIAVHTDRKTGQQTVIPGAQSLTRQIDHAAKFGSTKGVDAFLARIAPTMKDRRHSIDDLMNFMERGDLPIADDGCILVYKALRNHPTLADHYIDAHSKKVTQRVGSYVFMDPSLVDRDNRNECSNGLHVARRAYMQRFGGDACFLIKVRPEDAIAVPHEDANKMRVCGYHIIFKLSAEDHKLIQEDKAFTATKEARTLLGRAIKGDHPPIDQHVQIRGSYGGDLLITDVLVGDATPVVPTKAKPVEAIKLEAKPVPVKLDAPVVQPTTVAKKVAVVKAKVAVNQRQATAQAMFEKVAKAKPGSQTQFGAARALVDFKRAAKVGWDKLGITGEQITQLQNIVDPVAAAVAVPAPEPAAPVKMADPSTFKPTPTGPKSKDAAEALVNVRQTKKAVPVAQPTKDEPKSREQRALLLWGDVEGLKGDAQKAAAVKLLELKKASKVSWTKLGLGESTGGLLKSIKEK